MSRERKEGITITIRTAVRQTGLSDHYVRECIHRRLVCEPLDFDDLVELRRIRRLQELGVNMAGIEVILRMRQQIRALQAEMDRLDRGWQMPGWFATADREPGPTLGQVLGLLPWDKSGYEEQD